MGAAGTGRMGMSLDVLEVFALLAAEFPTCVDRAGLLARVNALPGEPVASVGSMRHKAHELGIAAPPHIARAIQAAAGQRGGRSTETGTPSKPSEARTEERFAAFPALWQDVSLSVGDIQARLNAMPGKPMASSTQLYGWAKKAGLPTHRGMPEEAPDLAASDTPARPSAEPEAPPAPTHTRGGSAAHASAHARSRGPLLPAVADEKADAFDAFDEAARLVKLLPKLRPTAKQNTRRHTARSNTPSAQPSRRRRRAMSDYLPVDPDSVVVALSLAEWDTLRGLRDGSLVARPVAPAMTDPSGWPDDAVNAAEDAVLGCGEQWRQSVDRVLAALAPFVDARVEAARREGLREAAGIARAVIMEWQHYEDATDADALAKDVAAAILACAEGKP
jgi:hypothetical protein